MTVHAIQWKPEAVEGVNQSCPAVDSIKNGNADLGYQLVQTLPLASFLHSTFGSKEAVLLLAVNINSSHLNLN